MCLSTGKSMFTLEMWTACTQHAIILALSEGLHTADGLFCFLDFRLDLCFEPLDFVFFKRGKRHGQGNRVDIEEGKGRKRVKTDIKTKRNNKKGMNKWKERKIDIRHKANRTQQRVKREGKKNSDTS